MTKMKDNKTQRGFEISEFTDSYGEQCSLQKSSSVAEKIWLGIDNPKLTVFEDEQKGKYSIIDMPKNYSVSTRMHLDKEQVAELLPYLERFVKTGNLHK